MAVSLTSATQHLVEKGEKGPMDRQGELSIIRAAYAKQILAAAWVVGNARLEAALSATRREDFLGTGPWFMLRRFGEYRTTPDADPVYLYTDDLIGILPERQINNGQPSLHAHLIPGKSASVDLIIRRPTFPDPGLNEARSLVAGVPNVI